MAARKTVPTLALHIYLYFCIFYFVIFFVLFFALFCVDMGHFLGFFILFLCSQVAHGERQRMQLEHRNQTANGCRICRIHFQEAMTGDIGESMIRVKGNTKKFNRSRDNLTIIRDVLWFELLALSPFNEHLNRLGAAQDDTMIGVKFCQDGCRGQRV